MDIDKIIAQRQAIDDRHRPASDFQMTVTDRAGKQKTVWNPKVGGEAAYKEHNAGVDEALKTFDNGPLGSILKTHAQGLQSGQSQNQAQIDYHKTGLGQLTYLGKEAAPWVLGLPIGAAETYGIRKAIGLGHGSPLSARAGAILGGLGVSGLEGYLAHQAAEHGKDPTLTPFMHDVNEGLENAGNAAALSNAVGSIISPFIGTGGQAPKTVSGTPVSPTPDAVKKALEAAKKAPPAFAKGDTPTQAMRELARYLDVPAQEGAALKIWGPQVAKAAADASDPQIFTIASNARPVIQGGRSGVLEWINKLSKPGARRLPVVAGVAAGLGAANELAGNEEAQAGDRTSEMHGPRALVQPPRPSLGERLSNIGKSSALDAYGSMSGPSSFGMTGEQLPSALADEAREKAALDRVLALPHPSQSNPEELRARMSEMRNLERAQAEDARQREELRLKRLQEAGPPPQKPLMTDTEFNQRRRELQPLADKAASERNPIKTLTDAAEEDARAAGAYAKGGSVHIANNALSQVQTSLEADLKKHSKKIETLEKAKPSNAVHKALHKAQDEQGACIDKIWAVHHLARAVNAEKIHLKPGMTKEAIIALAMSHGEKNAA